MHIHELIEKLRDIETVHPETVVKIQIEYVSDSWATESGCCLYRVFERENQGIESIDLDSENGQTVAVIVPGDGLW